MVAHLFCTRDFLAFRARCLLHWEETATAFAPSTIRDTIFSGRTRDYSLSARCRRFFLGEDDKVMLEQLELGSVLKSTLPRLCLIIYVGEFLPRKKVSSQN
jgi:hypothetical protein